jgi:hypothetical protein
MEDGKRGRGCLPAAAKLAPPEPEGPAAEVARGCSLGRSWMVEKVLFRPSENYSPKNVVAINNLLGNNNTTSGQTIFIVIAYPG